MSLQSITAAQREAIRDAAVKAEHACQPLAESAAVPDAAAAAKMTAALLALSTALAGAGIGA